MLRALFFLLCFAQIFCAEYDCIFVGTSPQSLFEALYQHALGKTVLILEEHGCCGGAWQSVDVCGVMHADVGCHEIGNGQPLKEFLEEYAGCSLLSFDSGHSFYFSHGCYELVHNLECRIQNSSIRLLKNHKVERVQFDNSTQTAIVESQGEIFIGRKVYAPSYAYFPLGMDMSKEPRKTEYPHLYLLIQDPTPPRFSYRHGVAKASRMMNLTHFVDLEGTGRQLIVFQTWSKDLTGESFLEELKKQNLVDPSAYILQAEWFTYEQYPVNGVKPITHPCFEQLQTFDFRGITSHIARWKGAIVPFADVVP